MEVIFRLFLSCLKTLFEGKGGDISFEEAQQHLAEVFSLFANNEEFGLDSSLQSHEIPAMAKRELRDWINKKLVVEREGNLLATDALQHALQFIDALGDRVMTSTAFHSFMVRQRRWHDKDAAELIKACTLCCLLEPGCAMGMPLRTLSLAGIDSKFFERHRTQILKLLDIRFDGLPGEMGLELYRRLLETDKGRLEQEFLPKTLVYDQVLAWRQSDQALPKRTL
ncbi:MAG: DUF3375 family protein [Endozoicomonas sp.]